LSRRGVGLVILSIGGEKLDTRHPASKLMMTILAGVATWEREIMLERQREGIAKAKGDGKYKGRKPTARAKADQIMALAANGMTREAIAAQLDVGVASVYRVLSAGRP
jgi:DNA invertase Pin-like site-specific DNA recombinase